MSSDKIKDYNERIKKRGAWIDGQFLRSILKDTLEKEIQIFDYKVNAAVGAGDNYLGTLYRVQVTFKDDSETEQKRQLIVKDLPPEAPLQEIMAALGTVKKEAYVYKECVPALQRVSSQYFPDIQFVTPFSYNCSRPDTIVMEDLAESGYKMADRQLQLDFEHISATLTTLALFHALSVKVFQENEELIVNSTSEYFTEEIRLTPAGYLEQFYPGLAQVVETWDGYEKYGDDLREIGKHMWDKAMHCSRRSKYLNVMNHGDLWVNNIMFKYNDDDSIHSAKLIDFQLARFTTPALDLHYFLCTSVQPDILRNRMFELLEVYHTALVSNLKTIKVNINYSLEVLHEEMRDRAVYGFVALAQVLPMILAPPAEYVDFSDFDHKTVEGVEGNPMINNYRTEKYRKVAGSYLAHADAVGYLQEAKDRMKPVVESIQANALTEDKPDEGNSNRNEQQDENGIQDDSEKGNHLFSKLWRMLTYPVCQ